MTKEGEATTKQYLDKDALVQKALDETPYHKLLGVPEDHVRLSPRWVIPVERVASTRGPSTPASSDIRIDKKLEGECLHSRTWEQNNPIEVGIWLADLDFPEYCCVCMDPMTHYELLEISHWDNLANEVKASDQWIEWRVGDQWKHAKQDEWVKRLQTAVQQKRSWLVVPFCNQHDAESAQIHFERTFSVNLRLPNHEFSQIFAEQNNLQGKWVTRSNATAWFIAMILFMGSVMWLFMEYNAEGTIRSGMMIVALVLLISSIIVGLKWARAESLTTNRQAT